MQHPRLWLATFAAGFATITALLLVTLFTPAFVGDLTRVARLSESAFGPREAASAPPVVRADNAPLASADVLVIGDSFSIGRLWQLQLQTAGLRVATLQWDDTGPLCADLNERLTKLGFRGKWLILQTVERELATRLEQSLACARMSPIRQAARPSQEASAANVGRLNTGEALMTGVITWWHTRQAAQTSADWILGDATLVRVRPLADGCMRFSHVLCNKGLFLAVDDERLPAGTPQIEHMRSMLQRPSPWTTTWLVVPDKSSVYVAPSRLATLQHALLADPRLGIDTITPLMAARDTQRDLYLPNDTHLSPQGFALLGRVVRDELTRSTR